jgi:hypothetical protein
VEGIACLDVPAFSVQYHPEAAAGPHDAEALFDRFRDMVVASRRALELGAEPISGLGRDASAEGRPGPRDVTSPEDAAIAVESQPTDGAS